MINQLLGYPPFKEPRKIFSHGPIMPNHRENHPLAPAMAHHPLDDVAGENVAIAYGGHRIAKYIIYKTL